MYGQDEDDIESERAVWSNSPGDMRPSRVGYGSPQEPEDLRGYGEPQNNMPGRWRSSSGDMSDFGEQQNIPETILGFGGQSLPEGPPGWGQQREGLRGYGEDRSTADELRIFAERQQNMPGGMRSYEDQRNMADVQRNFNEPQNIPGNFRNVPASLRGFEEQRLLSENLRNMPGDPRNLPMDVSPYGDPRFNYRGQQQPQDAWAYPNDPQNYRSPPDDMWNIPAYARQRANPRPAFLEDFQNYGDPRGVPDNLQTMDSGMYDQWNSQPSRYNAMDLTRYAPLMMVSDDDVNQPISNRLAGYRSL